MHKKMRNLIKMWGKEGYEVKDYKEHTRSGNVLTEVDLSIFRSDGHYIRFMDEWDTFKSLASRQGFYVLPVCENNNDGLADIVLVIKDCVYQMHHKFQSIRKALRDNYWFVQGDEEVSHLEENTIQLCQGVYLTHTKIKRMISMDPNSPNRHLFDDGTAFSEWDLYVARLWRWSQRVEACEKISDEIKEQVREITEYYTFK